MPDRVDLAFEAALAEAPGDQDRVQPHVRVALAQLNPIVGDIDGNAELAANLKGHLLLTTGDVDNNVHPANTYRMAEALIRAGKRFDFFLFPGQRHGFGNMSDYWFWLRAEYFVRHLLGTEPPDRNATADPPR